MADIKIQRGTAVVDNASGSTSPTTDFGSLTSTFVLNSNNRYSHGGDDSQTASNREGDDMSGGIHLSAVDTIEVNRISASYTSDTRFAWEAWEYTGSSGGDNEFIVRGRYKLELTGETTTQAVSDIVDIDNCIPFITGIFTTSSADDWDSATAICWMSSTGTLNIKRGSGSNNTCTVYVTVVEFTGSNWQVAHGDSGENGADSGTITLRDDADGTTTGGGDITDWDTALIFHQFCKNSADGVDDSLADTSACYRPNTNTTQVDWLFNANHVDSLGEDRHFVHVLKHSDMSVTRYTSTASLGSAMNVDVTSASLDSLDTSVCLVSRSSSGNGTAYGRGWVNIRLTSTTNAELWVHRSGNTIDTALQIADLSAIVTAATNEDVFGACALTSTSTLDVAGTIYTDHYGACTLTSASELEHNLTITYDMDDIKGHQYGVVNLDTTNTMTAAGDTAAGGVDVYGVVDLDTVNTLTSDAGIDTEAIASFTSTTTMVASSSTAGIITGSVSLNTSTSLVADGTRDLSTGSTFNSPTSMSVTSDIDVGGAASLVSVTDLDHILHIKYDMDDIRGYQYGVVGLSSPTTLTATPVEGGVQSGAADLSSSTTISIDAGVLREAAVTLDSIDTLTASGEKYGQLNGAVSFLCPTSMSVTPKIDKVSSTALTSTSSMATIGWVAKIDYSGAILASTFDIYAEPTLSREAIVDLDTINTMTSSAEVYGEKLGDVSLDSTFTLNATGDKFGEQYGTTTLASQNTLAVDTERDRESSVALTSPHSIAVSAWLAKVDYSAAVFNSPTTMSVGGSVDKESATDLDTINTMTTSAKVYGTKRSAAWMHSEFDLQADGDKYGKQYGKTTFNSISSVSVDSERDRETSSTLISPIGIEATGDTFTAEYGSATLTSATSLNSDSARERETEASLDSFTTIGALARADNYVSTSLTSTLTMTTVAWVAKEDYSGAILQTTSSIIGTPSRDIHASTTLTSVSSMEIIAESGKIHSGTVDFSSPATMISASSKYTYGALAASSINTLKHYLHITYPMDDIRGHQYGATSLNSIFGIVVTPTSETDERGSAALETDTSITIDTAVLKLASTELDTVNTINASGDKFGEIKASASWTSTSSIEADSEIDKASSSALTSPTDMTAIGSKVSADYASVTLQTTSIMATVANRLTLGIAAVATTATMLAAGSVDKEASSSLSTVHSMTVSGSIAGSLSGASNLFTTNTIDIDAIRNRYTSVSLSSETTISGTPTSEGVEYGESSLDSPTYLGVDAYRIMTTSIDMSSISTLTATYSGVDESGASLSTITTLEVDAKVSGVRYAETSLVSTTTMDIKAGFSLLAASSFDTTSTLTADGYLWWPSEYADAHLTSTSSMGVLATLYPWNISQYESSAGYVVSDTSGGELLSNNDGGTIVGWNPGGVFKTQIGDGDEC